MSVTSLPEWKQLLLEKKRRDEEERGRREKEEEEKLANMPAWKRGIIQRRKAKQENVGERDKERDQALGQADVRSDGLSDTDSWGTVTPGMDSSFGADPGPWLDEDLKSLSQVSTETIVPVHENLFIRTQSVVRKGREAEAPQQERAHDGEHKEKDRGVDAGRDVELRIERLRDLSEGREKERSRDRSQGRDREKNKESYEKEKNPWKETAKDSVREKECPKSKREEDEKETDSSSSIPSLRTIRAENIIIIEQDRKFSEEKVRRWVEVERDRPEDDHQGKRGMKMDLREILAGGGSVTEIRASEVLIIKPLPGSEDRTGGKDGRDHGEMKGPAEAKRDLRNQMVWLREKELTKEEERLCGQTTVIKEDRKDSWDDSVFVERGGRVSQLLSKFGEHPKPPSRSKSSDNFLKTLRRITCDDQDEQEYEQRQDRKNAVLKGVPKRSFSFSDRVVSSKENGLDEGVRYYRNIRDRIHSERTAAQWADVTGLGARIKLGSTRLNKLVKNESEPKLTNPIHKRMDSFRSNFDRRAAEKASDTEGDEGFTVACVKNIEGISFARRLPIRQDAKAKPADVKRQTSHRGNQKSAEREQQTEERLWDKKVLDVPKEEVCSRAKGSVQSYAAGDVYHSTEPTRKVLDSSDSSTQTHSTPDRELTELCQSHSALSQQTEDLIHKIEKVGEAFMCSEIGERAHWSAFEKTKTNEGLHENESQVQDVAPKSPKINEPKESQDIQIPRTVFYVADELMDGKIDCGQNNIQETGADKGRDGRKTGMSLSSIECLREKIRQRKLRQKENEDGNTSESEELTDGEAADEGRHVLTTQIETSAHLQQTEKLPALSTSTSAPDVTAEVCGFITCPELPVSVPHSVVRGEEVTNNKAADSEGISENFQSSEDEVDPPQHIEGKQQEEERDEEERQEEVEKEYNPVQSAESLSPSPPHPNSLAAMSRIYNLETVGSRSGLCLRDRSVESSSVHLVQVRPLAADAPRKECLTLSPEEAGCVQAIQRHIERLHLSDQEVTPSHEGEEMVSEDFHHKSQETVRDLYRSLCSPTSSQQTMTINSALIRSQSPESPVKPLDLAPTPASSPCSPSPSQSPSQSPSPSPSPTLFSIRSAAGGCLKRGATITITPKKPAGTRKASSPVDTNMAPQQGQVPAAKGEPVKRYLAVEEIQVIGGYLVDKSCLAKSKGIPKKGKVCFDEGRLEQVCEYPSETSMSGSNPPQEEEAQKEGVKAPAAVPKTQKSVALPTGLGLRVDECCPRS